MQLKMKYWSKLSYHYITITWYFLFWIVLIWRIVYRLPIKAYSNFPSSYGNFLGRENSMHLTRRDFSNELWLKDVDLLWHFIENDHHHLVRNRRNTTTITITPTLPVPRLNCTDCYFHTKYFQQQKVHIYKLIYAWKPSSP